MSPIEYAVVVVIVAQFSPQQLQEQAEFEATLATSEGYQHVVRFVEDSRFYSSEFAELAASATQSQAEEVPLRALEILRMVGQRAAAHEDVVLPFLSHEDRNLRIAAIECLGAMHPGRFYPEIARMAVFDEDDRIRDQFDHRAVHTESLKVLARCESLKAAPYLLAAFLDDDPQRAAEAIRATADCSPELQQLLTPGLIQVLRRQDVAEEAASADVFYGKLLRVDAIEVLGGMGPVAAPYLDEIERMQSLEASADVRIDYAVAIVHIGGHNAKQIEIVQSSLRDSKQRRLQFSACYACMKSRVIGEALLADVLELADDEEPELRRLVAEFFESTDHVSPKITAALQQLSVDYEDYYGSTCWFALRALARRGELTEPLKCVLNALEALEDFDVDAPYAMESLDLVLDRATIAEQMEAEFATADDHRRAAIVVLLDYVANDADRLQRMLELSMLDEHREQLGSYLEYAMEPYAPTRVTDWRLPAPMDE